MNTGIPLLKTNASWVQWPKRVNSVKGKAQEQKKIVFKKMRNICTWKFPRLTSVEVNFSNVHSTEAAIENL